MWFSSDLNQNRAVLTSERRGSELRRGPVHVGHFVWLEASSNSTHFCNGSDSLSGIINTLQNYSTYPRVVHTEQRIGLKRLHK